MYFRTEVRYGVIAILKFRPLSLAVLWYASAAVAGSNPALANLKSRTAGTSGESKAIKYVAGKLRRVGLDVRTEPFNFTGFDLVRATLRAGGLSVEPTRVLFDPYRSTVFWHNGECRHPRQFPQTGQQFGGVMDPNYLRVALPVRLIRYAGTTCYDQENPIRRPVSADCSYVHRLSPRHQWQVERQPCLAQRRS